MLYLLFIFLCCAFLNQAAILHCDFETDCNDFTLDTNWGLTNGENPRPINHDHTLNTSAGHYLFYDPKDGQQFPMAQIKTSDWVQPSTDRAVCFRMWYYTTNITFPFNIQLVQGDDEKLTRIVDSISGKDPLIDDWTLINVTLPNEKIKIFIRLNVTSKYLAFDDLSVDYCDGPPPLPPKVLYACDFESVCSNDFVSLPFYPYQWTILNASDAVKIESNAPSVDYTFGNDSGHYALLPNSGIVKQGNVGYLYLQKEFQITAEKSYCLNFQYYGYSRLYGSNLRIYSWTSDESKTVQMLWPARGSGEYMYTDNNWTWGIINLPIGHYSLLFRIDNANSYRGAFALDNIDVTSCDYPSSDLSPYNSLLSFTCNFDNLTMCDMINDDGRSPPTYNFTVFTGDKVPNPGLGPTRDHTSNSTSGGFLYWNQSLPFSTTDFGRVYPSKTVEQNLGMCVKFAYYVRSRSVNKNGTTVGMSAGGCYGASLWYLSLDDSQGWQTAVVPVVNSACAETFYFEVNQRVPTAVSVAFDDIEIDQCNNSIPTTTSTSTSTIMTTTRIITTSSSSTTSTISTTTISSTVSTTTIISTTTPIASTTTYISTTTPIASTTTYISTTTPIAPTTTYITTTPSNAHRLLSLNGFSLIIIYFFCQIFREYFFN